MSIRIVKERDLDKLYSLSFDYEDPGDFLPLNFISETDYIKEFRQTGFWKDNCGKLIIEDSSGEVVGEIGCFKTTHYVDGREVYYRIFSGYRNKGYASEALRLFIRLFFESSSMNRLQAVIVDGNEVSEYLIKKQCFRYEGTMKEARYISGKLTDLKLFSLVRREWQSPGCNEGWSHQKSSE
ncbi:GNAT family N-acetyltransferase [Vibrio sinaloensis]|uniref:GNAT family N-acetyltransferase n=1 Tax=Photobacterium sp. (strain ATCC 43367) TaxID=379097 RepID=UPI00205AECBE|nr:GNAT family protein [Vibrio sinaloensis]UPQ89159.1 GNAT family N-acetyltransferase [Vibrio sinaloensis]